MRNLKPFMSVSVCLALIATSVGVFAFIDPGKPRKQSVGEKIKAHTQAVTFARVNPAQMLETDPDWADAAKEVYADQGRLKSQLSRLNAKKLSKYVLRRGSSKGLKIALTFDDGPHPDFTPKLVQILKSEDVPATFFVIGHMVEKYPDMVKLLSANGFEVANHTYSHVTLTKVTDDQAETEYLADNEAIKKAIGKAPRYCRPPGGDFDLNVLEAAAAQNLKTVLWTDDPGDYYNPGDSIVLETETAKLSSGGIILLHDGSKDTIDTLATFIRSCKRRGFHFVTLDELQKD